MAYSESFPFANLPRGSEFDYFDGFNNLVPVPSQTNSSLSTTGTHSISDVFTGAEIHGPPFQEPPTHTMGPGMPPQAMMLPQAVGMFPPPQAQAVGMIPLPQAQAMPMPPYTSPQHMTPSHMPLHMMPPPQAQAVPMPPPMPPYIYSQHITPSHMPLHMMPPEPPAHVPQLEQNLQVSVPHGSRDQQITDLMKEVAELKRAIMLRDWQFMTLFMAYNFLLMRIPTAVSTDLGPLRQADYPNVQFWHLNDWSIFYAANRSIGPMKYIQDKDGQTVDDTAISAIRNLASSIWFEFEVSGAASSTWSRVDEESKKRYYRAMAAGFFNLRLCDLNWKAEQIALDTYPLWILRISPDHQSDQKRTTTRTRKAVPLKKPKVSLRSKESMPSSGNHDLVDLSQDTGNPERATRMQAGISKIAGTSKDVIR